jgi:type I restriction enzyme R subunit
MAARKLLTNASYFAFTATPKNKTLEMFGVPLPPDAEGKVKHRPLPCYTMKQAIEEGFILDVLKSYTPVDSYYKLVKKTEDDPEFDTRKAQKKLRKYVRATTTRFGSRPRSWWITSTSRCWRPGRSGGRRGRWR